MKAHWMTAAVPLIEIADYADSLRVRRPDREMYPTNSIDHSNVRTKLFIVAIVRPLRHQVEVIIGKKRRKAVRIVKLPGISKPICGFEPISESVVPVPKGQLEEPFIAEPVHRVLFGGVIRFDDPELFGPG